MFEDQCEDCYEHIDECQCEFCDFCNENITYSKCECERCETCNANLDADEGCICDE